MHTFGASAPLKELQKTFGFEPSRMVEVATAMFVKSANAERLRPQRLHSSK